MWTAIARDEYGFGPLMDRLATDGIGFHVGPHGGNVVTMSVAVGHGHIVGIGEPDEYGRYSCGLYEDDGNGGIGEWCEDKNADLSVPKVIALIRTLRSAHDGRETRELFPSDRA